MARERNPNREKALSLYREHGGNISNRKIAELLDEDEKKIAVWKQRDNWKGVVQQPENVVQHEKSAVVQQRPRRGAPKGNRNSVGHGAPKGNQNAKGHGAPKRNQNALRTGEYATIWLDSLDEEEQDLYHCIDLDPLAQMDENIRLLTLRERRMMKLLAELKEQREKPIAPGETSDLADDVTKTVEQSEGENSSRSVIVERRIMDKIISVEEALTRVQKEKVRAIEAKHRLLKDLEGAGNKEFNVTIARKAKESS